MQNGKTGDRRVVNSVQGLKEDFAWHLRYTLAKYDGKSTPRDQYTAFAYAVRDRLVERWMETARTSGASTTFRLNSSSGVCSATT